MANTVDIEVNLSGAEEAKRGLKGIGETAGSVAGHFEKFNEGLGEGLGEVVGNVEELGGSFKELGSTIKKLGTGGKASLGALVPALGGVAAAGFALFQTYEMITGAAQEAETAQEAMAGASSDLQSKLEALAEQGIVPAANDMLEFAQATLKAQFAKTVLEKGYEKLTPVLEEVTEAQLDIIRLEKEASEAFKTGHMNVWQDAQDDIKELEAKLPGLNKKLETGLLSYRSLQLRVTKDLAAAAEKEEALSQLSLESTKSRVLELKKSVEALELEKALGGAVDAYAEAKMIATSKKISDILSLEIQKHIEDENVKELRRIEKGLTKRKEAINQREVIEARFQRSLKEASDKEWARHLGEMKLRPKIRKETNSKELQEDKRKQRELFALRALDIQHMRQTGATALQVLDAQYNLELERAGENYNLKLMADLRYEMAKTELIRAEGEKRKKDEQEAFNESEALKERFKQQIQDQIDYVGEFTDRFGSSIVEAGYGAAFLGESFKESTKDIIHALGKQSAVQALIETASGFSALAWGNVKGAADHFTAALGFAAGAAAAGVAGTALGGGGGGGGGGVSPSGSPQIAPPPERERAQETSTVFNINFGGAVIYDTKQAAERAMVDKLVGVMNQRNRGSRRLNMGSV